MVVGEERCRQERILFSLSSCHPTSDTKNVGEHQRIDLTTAIGGEERVESSPIDSFNFLTELLFLKTTLTIRPKHTIIYIN